MGKQAFTPGPGIVVPQSDSSAMDVLREIVRIADTQPFCAIGHVVEHLVPAARDVLTTHEEIGSARGELVAKIQAALNDLSMPDVSPSKLEYVKAGARLAIRAVNAAIAPPPTREAQP